MNIKRVWNTDGRASKPEFRQSGIALDYVQFCYRNVCGAGAATKPRAILNWLKQVRREIK